MVLHLVPVCALSLLHLFSPLQVTVPSVCYIYGATFSSSLCDVKGTHHSSGSLATVIVLVAGHSSEVLLHLWCYIYGSNVCGVRKSAFTKGLLTIHISRSAQTRCSLCAREVCPVPICVHALLHLWSYRHLRCYS